MQALIYIVEDDMNIQEIEMFALKNTGYVTEGFANAKSFISRMTEKILVSKARVAEVNEWFSSKK